MLAVEEGAYWAADAGHTFGVGKSTDDHLQKFLRDLLPDHKFTSGQFLSGFKSRVMQANDDLSAIANEIKQSETLTALVATASHVRLMEMLQQAPEAAAVVSKLGEYLDLYGHQGFSLDFVEPSQLEDSSALMLTLQNMVRDKEYDPEAAYGIATQRRQEAMSDITELLGQDTLAYWQFRFRLWFSSRFYYIREETVFYLGSAWPVLRPMALELGRRFVESGMLSSPRGIFFLRPPEIEEAIAARAKGAGLPELVGLAEERDQLREARKRVHPPGLVPPGADEGATAGR